MPDNRKNETQTAFFIVHHRDVETRQAAFFSVHQRSSETMSQCLARELLGMTPRDAMSWVYRAVRLNIWAAYSLRHVEITRDGYRKRYHAPHPLEIRDTIAFHINVANRQRNRGDLARARQTLAWLKSQHADSIQLPQ